jgi:integrase
MKHPRVKIAKDVRDDRLRHPLSPSITRDSQIPGFALVVTKSAAHWCLFYQPPGRRPDGRRWGGGARVTLGDAFLMPTQNARSAALVAKLAVREGRDPLKEQRASRAKAEAERAIQPAVTRDVLSLYEKAVRARPTPKLKSRLQHLHYVGKAVDLLGARALPLQAISTSMIRIFFETLQGSGSERRHLYIALSSFLTWCRKQELLLVNPCDALGRGDKPGPGKSRENTPSLTVVRALWDAAGYEQPHVRDCLRLLILLPLRRMEACALRWSEVDLDEARITIDAARMKNNAPHSLPLSKPATELLRARKPPDPKPDDLVFTLDGKPYNGWHLTLSRVRKRIGTSLFRPHDLRRSFVSRLAEDGFDPDLLDLLLAHSRQKRGTFATYQRSTRMGERKAAVEAWAALVLEGGATSANVVRLNAAR